MDFLTKIVKNAHTRSRACVRELFVVPLHPNLIFYNETIHIFLFSLCLASAALWAVTAANGVFSVSSTTLSSASDWDDDQAGTDPGNTNVKYHGFYYKTHLVDAVEWDETDWEHPVAIAHYNFFLGANDALYWPTDGNDPAAKMKGFRAHFYVLTGSEPTGGPSAAPARGMRRNGYTRRRTSNRRTGATKAILASGTCHGQCLCNTYAIPGLGTFLSGDMSTSFVRPNGLLLHNMCKN